MSDIPKDVEATAAELVNATIRNYENNVPANVARDAVALAILAERQRCADIADQEAEGYKANGFPQAALGCLTTRRAILGN